MKLPPPRINLAGLQAVKVGVSRFSIDDPYYLILSMHWATFLVSVLGLFAVTNLFFAALYWFAPGSVANVRPGAFGDAFFFSVETLATVVRNTCRILSDRTAPTFDLLTTPNNLQRRATALIDAIVP